MPDSAFKTLAVLQPGFLPWIGFFQQMATADQFIIYDDVQYDKNGWRNRNRIKSSSGKYHWLTVPVTVSGLPLIKDVKTNAHGNWQKKHLKTIEQFYRKAPYFDAYSAELQKVYSKNHDFLIDLDMELIELFRHWFAINTPMEFSSSLNIGGETSERLVQICKRFNATQYYSGLAAQDYLDVPLFTAQNIQVTWQDYNPPPYKQINGAFLSHLSALDLLLNIGPDAAMYLQTDKELK